MNSISRITAERVAIAYIGLGSNLNNPPEQLNKAISKIGKLSNTNIIKISNLYWTKALLPTERPDEIQPDYCNAVLSIQTGLSPESLMKNLLKIESELGRERSGKRWEARIIDLDLLLFGDEVIKTPFLTVPHPEMQNRHFVLEPLFEIAPDLVLPEFV